ncbi:maltotransferase domain-containing protein, partial [Methylobacterium mesophilicum]
PVHAGTLIARTGGMLGAFVDRTPEAEPIAFHPGSAIVLLPGELRILSAGPAQVAQLPERGTTTGEGRVVIEAVSPEIDGGRSAVKRVVGESLRV